MDDFHLKPRKTLFKYPYSKKWVLFSSVLVAIAMVFTFFALTDLFSVLLFFIYTFLLTAIFLVLKFHLYSEKTEEKLDSLYTGEEKSTLKRPIVTLLILLIIGLSLPFSLLLFLSPFSWFICITGFIVGINIPETILYIYARRIERSNE